MTSQPSQVDFENTVGDIAPVSRGAFRQAFQSITTLVRNAQDLLQRQLTERLASYDKRFEEMSARIDSRLSQLKDGAPGKDGYPTEHTQVISDVAKLFRQPKDGQTPVIDYVRVGKEAAKYVPKPKDGIHADPQTVIDRIQSDPTAFFKNIPITAIAEFEPYLKKFLQEYGAYLGSGGQSSVSVMQSGTLKVQTAPVLNFKGSGAPTVTVGNNGVTHLDFPAGAGSSIITVTGTVDDSNVSFTAASTPTRVIVNGSTYRNGHGCTISGTSITLDNAIGTGGDIYAE